MILKHPKEGAMYRHFKFKSREYATNYGFTYFSVYISTFLEPVSTIILNLLVNAEAIGY